MRVGLWCVALFFVAWACYLWAQVCLVVLALHKALQTLTERTERQLLQAQATSRKGLK